MAKFFTRVKPKHRWLFPYQGGGTVAATTQAFAVAGRYYLTEFEVDVPTTIDAIAYITGTTAAGNVTGAIYGPIPTEETCLAAALIASTASTAQVGTTAPQTLALSAPVTLAPGRYYVGVAGSDATGTFIRQAAQQAQVTGWTQTYDRGGGYGAPTNPCPAVTDSAAVVPSFKIRCVV